MDKLGLIILAGGLSTRMGQPKALLPWINGESLISHALRKGLDADAVSYTHLTLPTKA